jgi:hypothetical protein
LFFKVYSFRSAVFSTNRVTSSRMWLFAMHRWSWAQGKFAHLLPLGRGQRLKTGHRCPPSAAEWPGAEFSPSVSLPCQHAGLIIPNQLPLTRRSVIVLTPTGNFLIVPFLYAVSAINCDGNSKSVGTVEIFLLILHFWTGYSKVCCNILDTQQLWEILSCHNSGYKLNTQLLIELFDHYHLPCYCFCVLVGDICVISLPIPHTQCFYWITLDLNIPQITQKPDLKKP